MSVGSIILHRSALKMKIAIWLCFGQKMWQVIFYKLPIPQNDAKLGPLGVGCFISIR